MVKDGWTQLRLHHNGGRLPLLLGWRRGRIGRLLLRRTDNQLESSSAGLRLQEELTARRGQGREHAVPARSSSPAREDQSPRRATGSQLDHLALLLLLLDNNMRRRLLLLLDNWRHCSGASGGSWTSRRSGTAAVGRFRPQLRLFETDRSRRLLGGLLLWPHRW